jgi:hypothetical protein
LKFLVYIINLVSFKNDISLGFVVDFCVWDSEDGGHSQTYASYHEEQTY